MAEITTVRKEMEKIYAKMGMEYIEHGNENVEKTVSMEEMRKEITDRAIEGDASAYSAYNRIEKRVADSRYVQAKAEMDAVLKDFNEIIAKDIRKSDESNEQQASRIWIDNDDLYIRISEAQRILDDLRGEA